MMAVVFKTRTRHSVFGLHEDLAFGAMWQSCLLFPCLFWGSDSAAFMIDRGFVGLLRLGERSVHAQCACGCSKSKTLMVGRHCFVDLMLMTATRHWHHHMCKVCLLDSS